MVLVPTVFPWMGSHSPPSQKKVIFFCQSVTTYRLRVVKFCPKTVRIKGEARNARASFGILKRHHFFSTKRSLKRVVMRETRKREREARDARSSFQVRVTTLSFPSENMFQ